MAARNCTSRFEPTAGEPRHRCRDCGETKPRSGFYRSRGKHGYSDRPMCRCIACYGKKSRAYYRRKYPGDPGFRAKLYETSRRNLLRRRFGLQAGEYDAMLAAQDFGCAICGATRSRHANGRPCRLAVDHDHATGKVRGLLCSRCNQMIGHVGEDVSILAAAIAYLKAHAS